jgi:DNA-binding transcriptional ArsR family regulator
MISRIRLYQKLQPSAKKFSALGNISRLSIVYSLGREAMEFGQLSRRLKISPSLLSHHLNVLVESGWITKLKVGKLVTYYISEKTVKDTSLFLNKLKI